jgi:hypothetical protein
LHFKIWEGQLSGIADNEVVVLDPSTGIFNSPLDTPSDNANNDYDPAQIEQELVCLTIIFVK